MAHVRAVEDELTAMRDGAWARLVAAPWRANEVPVEQRVRVLQARVDGWQPVTQKGITTSRMALMLRQGLSVSFMAAESQKYKEVVLFGLTLAWGIGI